MPELIKRRNSQSADGPPLKKRVTQHETDHIIDLLPYTSLKGLMRSLVKDPGIASSITEHLLAYEHTAAEETYHAILEELKEANEAVREAELMRKRSWINEMELRGNLPDFEPQIGLLRKAGTHGLELAWQALLKIANNDYHNGKLGCLCSDGYNRVEDDNFHWDMDEQMLHCCVELEARAPDLIRTTDKIRELKSLRAKITKNGKSRSAYRYYFTLNYLEWILGGKVGRYEDPEDYKPKISQRKQIGVRSKQTARKSAPSSKYMDAFRDRDDFHITDDDYSSFKEEESGGDSAEEDASREEPDSATSARYVTGSRQAARKSAMCTTNADVFDASEKFEDEASGEDDSDNSGLSSLTGSWPKLSARKSAPSTKNENVIELTDEDDDNSSDSHKIQIGRKSAPSTKQFGDDIMPRSRLTNGSSQAARKSTCSTGNYELIDLSD